jgi:ubiquinone biosynthesis protein COQ9
MGLGAHPLNSLNTFDKLGKISDDIWYISGDRSTDVLTQQNHKNLV